MSQKNDEIKRALNLATTDRSGEVSAAAGQVQNLLRSIQQPSLDAGRRGEFDAITRDLDATVRGFQSAYGQQAPSIAGQAKQLKTANTIRFIAFIVLLFIGIIVLFNNWLVGLILILVALIGSPIAKKVFAGEGTGACSQRLSPSRTGSQCHRQSGSWNPRGDWSRCPRRPSLLEHARPERPAHRTAEASDGRDG